MVNGPLKRISLLLVMGMIHFLPALSQERTHHGFNISMGAGFVTGMIKGSDNAGNQKLIEGYGNSFFFQFGYAVSKNLILQTTLGSKFIYSPAINHVSMPENYSFDEQFWTGGLTKYFPHNFYCAGTLGTGFYSYGTSSTTVETDKGLTVEFKVGKEWWISKSWALGVAFTYSRMSLTNYNSFVVIEEWSSNRYGVCFTGTWFKN